MKKRKMEQGVVLMRYFCLGVIFWCSITNVYARRNVKQALELRGLISLMDTHIQEFEGFTTDELQVVFAEVGTFLESAKKVSEATKQSFKNEMSSLITEFKIAPSNKSDALFNRLVQFRTNLLKLSGNLPLPAIKPSLKKDKETFQRHCASCHGVKGQGDGPLARRIKVKMLDWSKTESFHNINVSMHYNWLLGGKGKMMPSFREVLDAHDFWSVLFYVQTLPFQANTRTYSGARKQSLQDIVYLTNRQLGAKKNSPPLAKLRLHDAFQ